jgi:hypothetical protein
MKVKTIADYPEIASQLHPTKNNGLSPNKVSFGSTKKIWWKCSKADDHEWIATPNSRTSNSRTSNQNGCPCCAGKKTVLSNCLITTHPEIAKQWHSIKNEQLTPLMVTIGSNKKVWWKCPDKENHDWIAAIVDRKRSGCPYCAGRKVNVTNCLLTLSPEIAAQFDLDKNIGLTPSKITHKSGRRVWWKCAHGHRWKASICSRVSKNYECPYCTNVKVCPERSIAITHPEIAAQLHPTKNRPFTAEDFTSGSTKKVWWKCSKGDDHEWKDTPNHRTVKEKARNCPCCSGRKIVPSNCLMVTHKELEPEWNHALNLPLTLYNTSYGSKKKVHWKCCKCQFSWKASIKSRTITGNGCPKCNFSKGENKIQQYLINNHINHTSQWRAPKNNVLGNRKAFDFAVKRKGRFCFIEYHGEQHYIPINFGSRNPQAGDENLDGNLRRDKIKRDWCKSTNRPLLEIPYWDFDRIDEILDDWFAGREPTFSEPPPEVKKYEEHRQKILDRLRAKGEIE